MTASIKEQVGLKADERSEVERAAANIADWLATNAEAGANLVMQIHE